MSTWIFFISVVLLTTTITVQAQPANFYNITYPVPQDGLVANTYCSNLIFTWNVTIANTGSFFNRFIFFSQTGGYNYTLYIQNATLEKNSTGSIELYPRSVTPTTGYGYTLFPYTLENTTVGTGFVNHFYNNDLFSIIYMANNTNGTEIYLNNSLQIYLVVASNAPSVSLNTNDTQGGFWLNYTLATNPYYVWIVFNNGTQNFTLIMDLNTTHNLYWNPLINNATSITGVTNYSSNTPGIYNPPPGIYTVSVNYEDVCGVNTSTVITNVIIAPFTLPIVVISNITNTLDNSNNDTFTLNVTIPESYETNSLQIIFTATNGTNITRTLGNAFAVNTPVIITPSVIPGGLPPDGNYTVTVQYNDAYGNLDAAATFTAIQIKENTTAPSITVPSSGLITNGCSFTYILTETPNGGTIFFNITSSTTDLVVLSYAMNTALTNTFTFAPHSAATAPSSAVLKTNGLNVLPDGNYTATITFADLYGNLPVTSVPIEFTIKTSSLPPYFLSPSTGTIGPTSDVIIIKYELGEPTNVTNPSSIKVKFVGLLNTITLTMAPNLPSNLITEFDFEPSASLARNVLLSIGQILSYTTTASTTTPSLPIDTYTLTVSAGDAYNNAPATSITPVTVIISSAVSSSTGSNGGGSSTGSSGTNESESSSSISNAWIIGLSVGCGGAVVIGFILLWYVMRSSYRPLRSV